MANELKGGTGDAVKEGSAAGIGSGGGGLVRLVVLLEADDVEFEDIGGGEDEVGERAEVAGWLWGPHGGVEVVVGLDGRDAWGEVGAGVGEEPGGAVVDSGGPLHHLVCRETHGGFGAQKETPTKLFVFPFFFLFSLRLNPVCCVGLGFAF